MPRPLQADLQCTRRAMIVLVVSLLIAATAGPASAAGCAFDAARRGSRRRHHRCAQLSPAGWPRGPSRRHRAGVPSSRRRAQALARILTDREVRFARGRRHARSLWSPARLRVRALPPRSSVQEELLAQGEALVSATVTDKECASVLMAAEAAAPPGQTRHLGRSLGHKKRRKSGRYFGWDRAVYAGRGQGFVRPASGGNNLSEFRPELDTGLCCDYFKAGASRVSRRPAFVA